MRGKMAEDLIELAKEKYDKSDEYGRTAYATGMASLFTQGMGSILDYSSLKQDLKNYNLQVKGVGLSTLSVDVQATQMANRLRQQYIEAAGNYAYNAARRGVAVSSGSVQAGLRKGAEDVGEAVQTIGRNAEIEKKNLEMQKVALKAQQKIEKHQARANLAMSAINLGLQGAMLASMGAGSGVENMGGTKTGVVPLPTRKPV